MKKIVMNLIVLLCLAGILQAQDAPPGNEKNDFQSVTERTYSDVLDTVFPREIEEKNSTDWQITLRFHADSAPESQVVIRKTVTGVSVTHYRAKKAAVFTSINFWLNEHGREDVVEMSKLIEVERREVPVKRRDVMNWHDGFFASALKSTQEIRYLSGEFDRKGSWGVWLHGTRYQLWYEHNTTKIHYRFVDQEIHDTKVNGELALVRWMNQVRLFVQKNSSK